MTLYLQMDGVDDYITVPQLTQTEVQIDLVLQTPRYGIVRSTVPNASRYIYTNGWGSTYTLYWNGSSVTPTSVPVSTRGILKGTQTSGTHNLLLFKDNTTFYQKALVYSVKIYNDTTLVAHYDMATGTVQDQSGNGNHATLTGGTWVDDGTGVINGESTLSAISTLTSEGEVIAPDIPINLSATSSLSVDGSVIYNGATFFYGESSFDPLSNLIFNGESGLSASTSLTVEGISYDPSKQIIGKITLTGKRDLLTNLVATRDLNIKVSVKRELITRLVGDIK